MREGRERRGEGEKGGRGRESRDILIKLTLPSRVRRMRYFKIWGAGSLITPPTRSLLTWMVSLAIEGKRGGMRGVKKSVYEAEGYIRAR